MKLATEARHFLSSIFKVLIFTLAFSQEENQLCSVTSLFCIQQAFSSMCFKDGFFFVCPSNLLGVPLSEVLSRSRMLGFCVWGSYRFKAIVLITASFSFLPSILS